MISNSNIKLRLNYREEFFDEKQKRTLREIKNIGAKNVKINTIRLNLEYDKKDQRKIRSIKNMNIIYEIENNKIILLNGNMQCTFTNGFKGEFFVKKVIKEKSNFEKINGIKLSIDFSDDLYPINNDDLYPILKDISNSDQFLVNISQFDEFMEIFNYYKELMTEYNNNESFPILKLSDSYYFLDVDSSISNNNYEEIYDTNGIIKGYKLKESQYQNLPNDKKDDVKKVFDLTIANNKRIKKWDENNLYVSSNKKINVQNLKKINAINLKESEDKIELIVEHDDEINKEFAYLNYYDMGQQIKIESISESLKLINKSARSDSFYMIEYLIGDKHIPSSNSNNIKNVSKYIENLNESQKNAFLMAVDGSPVSLIKGPPGTGKTHVINAIVQYITKELDEKVIISSQTHIAIDNVLDKIMSNYDAIIPYRITNSKKRNKYSEKNIDKTLYKTWATKFEEHNARSSNIELSNYLSNKIKEFKGINEFRYSTNNLISNYKVIGATTTTSAISGNKGYETLKGYKWLIIDEVSKCPITEILRYIPYIEKIIMVGDDYQLSPLFEISKDDVKSLPSFNEDKFERLKEMYESSIFAKTLKKAKESNRLVLLNKNYRSIKQILDLYNVFYNGDLECMRNEKHDKKVIFNNDNLFSNDKDAYFIEVKGGKEAIQKTSRYNLKELEATQYILKKLMEDTKNKESLSLAIIFPYAAQIEKFQKNYKDIINEAKKSFLSFDMDTIDAFQGKEANIVLCNTVVADSTKKNFLNDFRRINVSLSRAQDKLFIFGNSLVLSNIEMTINNNPPNKYFKQIIEYIKTKGQYIIYENGEGKKYDSKNTIKFK